MASVTFSPQGTQLDNDEIADLSFNPGDRFSASFELDTSGLDANLQFFEVKVNQDIAEVELTAIRTDFDQTTFPNFNLVETSTNDNFSSAVFERNGSPGAKPDTINVIVEGEATALEGLTNDGQIDLSVTVTQATDANGTDVTELFAPSQQAVDVQSLSQVQAVSGTEKSEPIIGTTQNDLIKGKQGNDLIIDNEGDDNSFGGEGNDLFLNNAGNDTIIGGAGNDFVNIDPDSEGDDLIDLGTGNDFAFGGRGADTFVLNRDSGVIGIADFTPGEDRFALGENLTKDDLNFAQLDIDSLGLLSSRILISDAHTGKLIAVTSSATVEAVSNAEYVSAIDLSTDNLSTTEEENEPVRVELPEAQSGEIFGTPNPDLLVGDDGTNLISSGGDRDFINAGDGDDLVFGEDGIDILNGEAGRDLLNGGAGYDILNGGEGNDTLLGETADTFNILNGDSGNDILVGGSDSDVMSGGKGDDLLFGGAGNDGLVGNEGHDTFVFGSGEGADIISDFEPGQDAIALTSGSSYDSLQIEYNAQGNYTNISEETGELITTLIGVEADQLTESNFTTIQ